MNRQTVRDAGAQASDDPLVTGKIAPAHVNESADYYILLEEMEAEAGQARHRGALAQLIKRINKGHGLKKGMTEQQAGATMAALAELLLK